MINCMFKTIARMALGTGRNPLSINQISRPNRRRHFFAGLEGLEGRLAPTGIAPITVTVTNQQPTRPPTTPPAPVQPAIQPGSMLAASTPTQQTLMA